MSQQWNVTDVLDICRDGQCAGYAPSKGRRCKNRVSVHPIEKLLFEISRQNPNDSDFQSNLESLACLSLCNRNHRYQSDDLLEKWATKIRNQFPTSMINSSDSAQTTATLSSPSYAQHQPSTQLSPGAHIHTTGNSRSTTSSVSQHSTSNEPVTPLQRPMSTTASTVTSVPNQSETEILEEKIATLQENTQTAQRRPIQLRYNAALDSPIASLSRVSTSDISEIHLSRSTTVQSAPADRSEQSSSQSNPQHQGALHSTQPCTRSHVRRLPLDEECSICYDDSLLSQNLPSEILWCKSGCGRSVHQACFETWRAQCLQQDRVLICTICRTTWEPECEC